MIGALDADPGTLTDAGEAYLIFGKSAGFAADLDLGTLNGTNGVVIEGADDSDNAGRSVSTAGDVNGDGIDDLLIGAYHASPGGSGGAGETYVVFGQTTPFAATIDLGTLNGTNGFTLQGIVSGDNSGVSATTAGDVNGDGFDDLLIGSYFASPGGKFLAGESYLVFGHAAPFAATFNLSTLDGTNGIQFNGIGAIDVSGASVSSAGDHNGDGFDDLIIGAPLGAVSDPGGESYVVFGGDVTGTVTHAGDDMANLLSGTAAADNIVAGQDDDTLDGGGGADVLRAGEGDDLLMIGDASFFRADGGRGVDTLEVGAFHLDLTTIPDNRVTGIEAIDLATTAGAQTLTLNRLELVNLSDTSNTLIVHGTAHDSIAPGAGWFLLGTEMIDGNDFTVLTQGTATLKFDQDMNAIGSVLAGDVNSDGVVDGLEANILSLNWLADPATFAQGDANGDGVVNGLDANIVSLNWLATLPAMTEEATAASTSAADPPAPIASFDLADLLAANGGDGTDGFVLEGIDPDDRSGQSVSSAGDVNGDGFDDLLIGATYGDPGGVTDAGETYVVFGQAGGFAASLDLSTLNGAGGFVLEGIDAQDFSGFSVGTAGDVNGDGFDDILIGAYGADPGSKSYAGETYVVFGQAGGFGASLDLGTLNGTNGFALAGIDVGDYSGFSVNRAGDVNGDGFDDLLIGALFADPGGDNYAGESYVVFGQAGGFAASLDLSTLNGTNGFVLTGIDADDFSSVSVSSAGDANGDGFDDLLIGAHGADPGGDCFAGETYVVFGKAAGFGASLDLSTLNGTSGFVLEGIDEDDFSGVSVSSAGDVNGDGFDDLLIGALFADPPGKPAAGESYVVFGAAGGFAASLDLSTLNGSNGFLVPGIDLFGLSGVSVSRAGDVNGDGLDDLMIGARSVIPAGKTFVVFGAASGFASSFDLATLDGTNGFVLNGIDAGDYSGHSVSSAGDVNGDGFDDVLIGAYRADPGGNSYAGESYLFFGRDFASAVTHQGDNAANLLTGSGAADNIVAGQDDDTLDGAGGGDVLRAGEGDDLLQIGDATFFRADGGRGTDTLEVGAFHLDLTAIADNRLTGIEVIDLATAAGGQTLTLTKLEVLNLSDTSNTLIVPATAADTVDLGPGIWTRTLTETIGAEAFHVYTLASATVKVDTDANVTATVFLAGDVNSDGTVNGLDANILSLNWLADPATFAQGDANGDGVVNGLDANIISLNWLAALPAGTVSGPTIESPANDDLTDSALDADLADSLADSIAENFLAFSAPVARELTATRANGDVTGDGYVDGLDLNWLAIRLATPPAADARDIDARTTDAAFEQLLAR